MKRINIWSSPRNISTALMYAFAQRPETTVVDEPLYAHYLIHSGKNHPGKTEIINSMEPSGEKVVEKMLSDSWATETVIFKQMTHHLIALDRSFLSRMDHLLLIRRPEEIIASYAKVIPKVSMEDIGIKMQYDLYKELAQFEVSTVVLDAGTLLKDPRKCLQKMCSTFKIGFTEKMLSWKPGPRPEDGIWAKYWYANLHKSSGFKPYEKKDILLNGELKNLAKRCQPFYNFLLKKSIQP